MYVCVCVCVYIYIYIYIYVHTYIHAHARTCMPALYVKCTYTYIYIHTRTHAQVDGDEKGNCAHIYIQLVGGQCSLRLTHTT